MPDRLFLCGACWGEVTDYTDEEGWRHWSCPCGRTIGIMAPYGELDLGLKPVEEPVDVSLGEVVEQEP
jgi:hypothetical protein